MARFGKYGTLVEDAAPGAKAPRFGKFGTLVNEEDEASSTLSIDDVAPRPLSLEEIDKTVREDRGGSAIDFARSGAAGAVKGIGSSVRGLGDFYQAAGRSLYRPFEMALRESGLDDVADAFNTPIPAWVDPGEIIKRPGQVIEGAGEKIAVPEERQTFATQTGEGLGQIAGQLTAAILTGGASSEVSMALLLGQGTAQMEDMRKQYAPNKQDAMTDAALIGGGAITALLEETGLENILERMPPNIRNGAVRQIADIAIAGGYEAAQEVAEGVLQRLTAMAAFSPDIKLFEETPDEAAVGGSVGAIARGLLNIAMPGRLRTPTENAAQSFMDNIENAQWDQDGASVAVRQMDPKRAQQILTKEELDAEIPNDLLIEGKQLTAQADADNAFESLLDEQGLGGIGSRVSVDFGDGRVESGEILGGFDADSADLGVKGRGISIKLDNGNQIDELLETLQSIGVKITPEIQQQVQQAVGTAEQVQSSGGVLPAAAGQAAPGAVPSSPSGAANAPAIGTAEAGAVPPDGPAGVATAAGPPAAVPTMAQGSPTAPVQGLAAGGSEGPGAGAAAPGAQNPAVGGQSKGRAAAAGIAGGQGTPTEGGLSGSTAAAGDDNAAGAKKVPSVSKERADELAQKIAGKLRGRPASWVIREKATGAVIMETADQAKVDALNTAKYEAVPIQEHLASLNRPSATAPAPEKPKSDVLLRESDNKPWPTKEAAREAAKGKKFRKKRGRGWIPTKVDGGYGLKLRTTVKGARKQGPRSAENTDILTFIASHGGIDSAEGDDVKDFKKMTQAGPLVRKGGRKWDGNNGIVRLLRDNEYFPGENDPSVEEVKRVLADAIRHKKKIYRPDKQGEIEAENREAQDASEEADARAAILAEAEESGITFSETDVAGILGLMGERGLGVQAAIDAWADEAGVDTAIELEQATGDEDYGDIPFEPIEAGGEAREGVEGQTRPGDAAPESETARGPPASAGEQEDVGPAFEGRDDYATPEARAIQARREAADIVNRGTIPLSHTIDYGNFYGPGAHYGTKRGGAGETRTVPSSRAVVTYLVGEDYEVHSFSLKELKAAPTFEEVDTVDGKRDQAVIAGAEQDATGAQKAAKTKEQELARLKGAQKKMRAGKAQEDPGGMFAPKQEDLLSAPPASDYGANNKLVSKDRADELARKLAAKFKGQLNTGIDPEMMAMGAELAIYHIEAGARRFVDFARKLRSQLEGLGVAWPQLKPYVRGWYLGAQATLEDKGGDVSGMDSSDDVRAAMKDIDSASAASSRVEQDSGNADAQDEVGAPDVSLQSGRAGSSVGSRDNAPGERGRDVASGEGVVPGAGAAPVGERGDSEVRASKPDVSGRPPEHDGHDGGGTDSQPGQSPHGSREGAVRAAAPPDERLAAAIAAQKAAMDVKVVPADKANIDATLPFLRENQREDVLKAENRLYSPDGWGFLFTNGTGTGKTYVAGGLAARFWRSGQKNILIVVPSQDMAKVAAEALRDHLQIPAGVLDDTQSNKTAGVVATTYANLQDNPSLAQRTWDLVIADESQKLMSSENGEVTRALSNFRAITGHPDSHRQRAEMQLHKEVEALEEEAYRYRKGNASSADIAKLEALRAKIDALAEKLAQEPRSRVVFLSATPFAYTFNVDYAQGYLFDWHAGAGDDNRQGYNAGSNRDRFYMQHFGYRMRYNRLTKPDAGVDTGVMERQFHEWLKSQGVLSGRRLDVPFDYDRKFVLVDDAVGNTIDKLLDALHENPRFAPLGEIVRKRFNYLARERLLEAIKANHAIPYIKKQHALGRKVVVFHDYNEGGGFNPFDLQISDEETAQVWNPVTKQTETVNLKEVYAEFNAAHPEAQEMKFGHLGSPLATLQKAFPNALVYNGTIPNKQRTEAKLLFNTDGNEFNIIIVQAAAGEFGISLHDTTGKHQRVLVNLGLPTRPVTAIQEEGRIYRDGQASDAAFRYFNTGTNWERYAFATRIAERASTAENLALGNEARTLRDAFINAFLDSAPDEPGAGDGKGGKEADKRANADLTEWQRAVTFYHAQQKQRGRRDQREGQDYFPTPEPVGLKMVQLANLDVGEKALEPSAGHGAIARFFPEHTDRTLIEPSNELASHAGIVAVGAKVLTQRFEDLHLTNKYDAIVMNPPYGMGGKTAMEHVTKAMKHLRNGGRIVALIPTGGMADRRFDEMMESDAAKGIYLAANIKLPQVTFQKAGTGVMTRIVVLEKQTDEDVAAKIQQTDRDYTNVETIADLFDRMENLEIRPRLEPKTKDVDTTADADGNVTLRGIAYKLSEVPDSFQAKPKGKMGADAFRAAAARAGDAGGAYIRGAGYFAFPTKEGRDAWIAAMAQPDPAPAAAPQQAAPAGVQFTTGEVVHAKKNIPLYVAQIETRVEHPVYKAIEAIAKKHGGYYSAFRGRGAMPGFQFTSEASRAAFLAEASRAKDSRGRPDNDEPGNAKDAMRELVRRRRDMPEGPEREALTRQIDALEARRVAEIDARNGRAPFRPRIVPKDSRRGLVDFVGNFFKWFGDSKVVDENGAPLVMYHGTKEDIASFRSEGSGARGQMMGPGIYFTNSRDYAAKFSSGTGNTIAAYIRATKILNHIDAHRLGLSGAALRKYAIENGYDAIRSEVGQGTFQIVVFEPTQIKSTENNGNWDGENPNIRERRGALPSSAPSIDAEKIAARLKEVGLSDKVIAKIRDWSKDPNAPNGRYLLRMIEISQQATDQAWVLNHEIVHALRDLGLISNIEWLKLKTLVTNNPALMADIKARYPKLSLEEQIEEAIADTFAQWKRENSAPSFLAKMWDRITGFFRALRAARGDGYRDAGEIFQAIDQGYVGRRDPIGEMSTEERLAAAYHGSPHAKESRGTIPQETAINKAIAAPKPGGIVNAVKEAFRVLRNQDTDEWTWATADEFAGLRALGKTLNPDARDRELGSYVAARLSRHSAGQIEAFLKHGAPVWDAADQSLGVSSSVPGLYKLVEPLFKSGKARLFEGYAYARRVSSQNLIADGREHNLTDIDVQELLQLGQQHPEFVDIFDKVQAFKKATLDAAEAMGLVNAQQRATWEQADHIPFYRAVEENDRKSPRAAKGLAGQSPQIRRLTGGDKRYVVVENATGRVVDRFEGRLKANQLRRKLGQNTHSVQEAGQPIIGVIENLAQNITHLINASMRNHAAVMAIDEALAAGWAKKVPLERARALVPIQAMIRALEGKNLTIGNKQGIGGIMAITAIQPPVHPGNGIIAIRRQGQVEYYEVDDKLVYSALAGLYRGAQHPIIRFFGAFKNMLTRGVTAMPDFMVRNMVRDTSAAWIQSEERGFNIFKEAGKTLRALVTRLDDPRVKAIMAAGGDTGWYQNAPEEVVSQLRKLERTDRIGWLTYANPLQLFKVLERLGRASEIANRIVQYDETLKATGSRRQAAFDAADLMDFQLKGGSDFMLGLTAIVPFLNARIQGLYKLGRYAAQKKSRKSLLAKAGIIMAFSTALALINAGDDDDDGYNDLPEYVKDSSWAIPIYRIFGKEIADQVGLPRFLLIPKPFELGTLFGTVPERIVQGIAGNDSRDATLEAVARAVLSTFAFNPAGNPIAMEILQQWANKDVFRGEPIVGTYQQFLPAEDQYNSGTTQSAKGIGRVLGVSPARLEHAVRGFAGTAGMWFLEASDVVAEKFGITAPSASLRLDEAEIVRSFVSGSPVRNSKWVDEFYNLRDTAEGIAQSIRQRRQNRDTEGAQELLEENRGLVVRGPRGGVAMAPGLDADADRLARITRQMKDIRQSEDMTPAQKREELDRLIARRNEIAKARVKKWLEQANR